MKQTISLRELFTTFFRINAVTFGGGYTIVPVIRDEFMKKKGLIDEDEMLDIVALAQSGPGAMAISTSLLTGYKLRGVKGALTSLLASVLPCLIIISLLTYFYQSYSKNFIVKSALLGMAGMISSILILTVYHMGKAAARNHRWFALVLMMGAFAASYFFKVHTVIIIVTLGLIGLFSYDILRKGR